jgi:hypothetical protein
MAFNGGLYMPRYFSYLTTKLSHKNSVSDIDHILFLFPSPY